MADEPTTPPPDPVAAEPVADGWTRYQLSAACDGASRGHAERAAQSVDTEPLPVAELADAGTPPTRPPATVAEPLEPVRVWGKLRRRVRWSK